MLSLSLVQCSRQIYVYLVLDEKIDMWMTSLKLLVARQNDPFFPLWKSKRWKENIRSGYDRRTSWNGDRRSFIFQGALVEEENFDIFYSNEQLALTNDKFLWTSTHFTHTKEQAKNTSSSVGMDLGKAIMGDCLPSTRNRQEPRCPTMAF